MATSKLPALIEITIDPDSLEASDAKAVRALLKEINALEKESNGAVRKKLFTKSISTKKGHKETSGFDKIRERLEEIEEQLPDRKRRYLKRKDWDDPTKSPRAEVNQSAKKLTPRVSEEHVELFAKAAECFPNKRDALERAVELLAAEAGIEIE